MRQNGFDECGSYALALGGFRNGGVGDDRIDGGSHVVIPNPNGNVGAEDTEVILVGAEDTEVILVGGCPDRCWGRDRSRRCFANATRLVLRQP